MASFTPSYKIIETNRHPENHTVPNTTNPGKTEKVNHIVPGYSVEACKMKIFSQKLMNNTNCALFQRH